MKGFNNGSPEVCVQNIFLTIKNEVPFVRDKGVDPSVIDKPVDNVEVLSDDLEEVVRTYEPRVNCEDVAVSLNEEGNLSIIADITEEEEEEL